MNGLSFYPEEPATFLLTQPKILKKLIEETNYIDLINLKFTNKLMNRTITDKILEDKLEKMESTKEDVLVGAIIEGNLVGVEYLINHGVDINTLIRMPTSRGGVAANPFNQCTLLQLARKFKQPKVGIYLLQNGATGSIGWTNLTLAVEQNSLDRVKSLINNGSDPDKKDDAGEYPLFIAIRNNNLDIVKYLVEHGADVNPNNYLFNPLSVASKNNNFDIVKYLIDHGAHPNISMAMFTLYPLVYAIENNNVDMVRYLVEHGANPNLQNILSKAIHSNNLDIIKLLFEHGANPNILIEEDSTLLHIAIYAAADLEIIKYLIEKGVDINIEDDNGETVASIATQHDRNDIVDYLNNLILII